ncbi:hypothetical protein FHS26_000913 [Rhizobium pisi]|uniref:Uncharacterized protein n=1 Tax=Rhizobium pisi TaxID=574561 RepID=A0A7W5BHT6_9HYPH|nr:hypothetical protein [Rhizobium pisi]
MSRKSFHLHCQRIEASRNMARYYTLAIDARAGKHDDASRHDREHLVVAAEWSGLGMLPPVRREGDLCHVAGLGPAGCYTLGAFRRTAVEQNHIWMLELRLVELCLDALVIVVIHTAGESDLGPGRDQHLGLGAAACGKEIPGVDHRRGDVGFVAPLLLFRYGRAPASCWPAAENSCGCQLPDFGSMTSNQQLVDFQFSWLRIPISEGTRHRQGQRSWRIEGAGGNMRGEVRLRSRPL